jgi:hypothetical protein
VTAPGRLQQFVKKTNVRLLSEKAAGHTSRYRGNIFEQLVHFVQQPLE